LWVADLTQLTTWQGTCYIAVIADAYSRLCLGWSVRADKTVELVLEALDMAIWRRGQMRAAGAIHHSDQGSQPEFKGPSQRCRLTSWIVVPSPEMLDPAVSFTAAPVIAEAA
jgi:putative transposase